MAPSRVPNHPARNNKLRETRLGGGTQRPRHKAHIILSGWVFNLARKRGTMTMRLPPYVPTSSFAVGRLVVAAAASAGMLAALAQGQISRSPDTSSPEQKAEASVQATSPLGAMPPKDIAKKAFGSVVMISVDDKRGQPLAIGSGFFVAPGTIATNLHVIEGAGSAKVRLVGKKDSLRVIGTCGVDQRHDLVLLAVADKTATALTLAAAQPEIGEEVYAVGNPRGLEGTFSAGIVSGVRQIGDDSLLQVTAPISPGSSGGPMLNSRGETVGVAVATLKGGQNLNFAIPASAVKQLLASAKEPEPLDMLDGRKDARVKSLLSDMGGDVREGVAISAFEWENQLENWGDFSVSFKNTTADPLGDVTVLVIFYDRQGEPLETVMLGFRGPIGAGLAGC